MEDPVQQDLRNRPLHFQYELLTVPLDEYFGAKEMLLRQKLKWHSEIATKLNEDLICLRHRNQRDVHHSGPYIPSLEVCSY